MNVTLITNRNEYVNDIAEVIRAYLGMAEIEVVEGPADIRGIAGYAVDARLIGDDAPAAFIRAKKPGGSIVEARHPFLYPDETPLHRKREEKRALKTAVYRAMQVLEPGVVLPWGALTGIRPTKLYREMLDVEGEAAARRRFLNDFDVKEDKLALLAAITAVQKPVLGSIRPQDVDIYVGIPYCKTKCLYCSFASEVTGKDGVPEEYLQALCRDISNGAQLLRDGGYRTRACYIGGGTPTVLPTNELRALIAHIKKEYALCNLEFTVEAGRPDTVEREKLAMLKDMGVTRISLNPQSMCGETLRRIGRAHTPQDVEEAFAIARDVGFMNINMDVIAGLPGETAADMRDTLERITRLGPESLTVHTLAVKRSSRLKERMQEYPLPEAVETERMVALGGEYAAGMGMRPYYMYRQKYMRGNLENVGYVKHGLECIYNIDMMEEATSIMAHGAGAMTKRVFQGRDMRVERIPAPKDIQTYINKLDILAREKEKLFS